MGDGEDLPTGATVGGYRVDQLVARAGFANVYRGVELQSGESVAIKVLHSRLAQSAKEVARFQREFSALTNLRHENIVKIHAYGTLEGGRPYTAMEWLEGSTLREFMRSGALSLDEAVPLFAQLCDALDAAHAAGVIHRDLKASNVMLVRREGALWVKLVDFGIAKAIDPQEAARQALTTTGQALGTPYTMAPEQIMGRPLDGRTDIYALGVVLFEMLTGEKPFTGTSAIEVAEKHLSETPPSLAAIIDVPPAVDRLVARCLAKDPADRFTTPGEVAAALRAANALEGHLVEKREPSATDSHTVAAMGLHYEVKNLLSGEEGEELAIDVEDMVREAAKRCEALGMRLPVQSKTGFLAVLPLPEDTGARSLDLRADVLALALELSEELPSDFVSPDLVEVQSTVHRSTVEAVFRGGSTSFVGGELLDLDTWIFDKGEAVFTATEVAVEGMEGLLDTQPMPGMAHHLRVLGIVR